MADCVFKFLYCILYSMCTELSTTISAIQKKLVWVRYLLGTEPEGMILHYTINRLADLSGVDRDVNIKKTPNPGPDLAVKIKPDPDPTLENNLGPDTT